jgi:hypothetical protein
MDRRLATPEQVAAQADKLANIENGFYVQQPAKQ